MMLCLDAGNSRLKFGLCDGGRWIVRATLDYAAMDGLKAQLPHSPTRLIACNVAGQLVATRIEDLAHSLDLQVEWFHSGLAACGVTNGYATPTQLGADRWAALIGARGFHTGNAVVVMSGTATTIDVLDSDGTFRGGVILPGLSLMRRALAQGTAGLPLASGDYHVHPRNTDDAIASGAMQATLGAIERIAAVSFSPERHEGCLCLLSGGAAETLSPHLKVAHRHVDHLVLEGLARFGQG